MLIFFTLQPTELSINKTIMCINTILKIEIIFEKILEKWIDVSWTTLFLVISKAYVLFSLFMKMWIEGIQIRFYEEPESTDLTPRMW